MKVARLFFILFVISNVYATDIVNKSRQWFEWGEYNHIKKHVKEYLNDNHESVDSLILAELHLYLGVALYADGDLQRARQEFLWSLNFNSKSQVNEHYVSQEMYALFNTTMDEYRKNEKIKQQQKELQKENKQLSVTNKSILDNMKRKEIVSKRKSLLISAFSLTGLTLIAGGVSGYQYYLGEQEYEKFLRASENGNKPEYDRFRNNVKKYDKQTVVSGVATVALGLTSAVFYYVRNRIGRKKLTACTHNIDVMASIDGVNVLVCF